MANTDQTMDGKAMVQKKPAQKKVVQKATLRKFPIKKLQENCMELFGVSTSTFAGATYSMAGEYTIEEMRAHIEAWKKKGVDCYGRRKV